MGYEEKGREFDQKIILSHNLQAFGMNMGVTVALLTPSTPIILLFHIVLPMLYNDLHASSIPRFANHSLLHSLYSSYTFPKFGACAVSDAVEATASGSTGAGARAAARAGASAIDTALT